MNALTPTTGPMSAGASAMIPRNMRDAMEMANMMARTTFLAKEIQNPGGAMFVMEQAMRWNMSPFAVAMETSFIQGKPMFSGKIVAAAVVSSGTLAGRLSYEYSGAGDDRSVVVRGTLRGEDTPREVSVRVRDAKTSNKVWLTQPDQQLAYHGARVFARRHCPEVMLGVYAPEEFDEPTAEPRFVQNTAPADPPARPLAAAVAAAQETLPIIAPSGAAHAVPPGRWLAAVGKALAGLEDAEAVRVWRLEMGAHIGAVAERDDLMASEADRMISERIEALTPAAEPADADDTWPGPKA